MYIRKTANRRTAVLSDGTVLSLADLPPPNARWVASRKAIVVQAIEHALITRDDAMTRYGLTVEELDSWTSAVGSHGLDALKVTTLQRYRQTLSS